MDLLDRALMGLAVAIYLIFWSLIAVSMDAVGLLPLGDILWMVGVAALLPVVALVLPEDALRRRRFHAVSVDGTYLRETSRILGREITAIDLDQVAHLVWEHEPPFSVAPREYIGFYDQDPQLEMTIVGSTPTNESAQQIGTLGMEYLRGEIREELQRRVDNGSLITTLDLRNGEPLPGQLPPLQAGTEFTEDGRMLRSPSP